MLWWPVLISGLLAFLITRSFYNPPVITSTGPLRISLRIHHNGKSTAFDHLTALASCIGSPSS